MPAGGNPCVNLRLLELHASRGRVFVERDIAQALPTMHRLKRRMVRVVGLKLLDGEELVLCGIVATEFLADVLDLCDAVEDVADGLGKLVKGNGV